MGVDSRFNNPFIHQSNNPFFFRRWRGCQKATPKKKVPQVFSPRM
jgi:hypothetical protein